MISIDVNATWGDKPLSELQRFLNMRISQLGETPQDACISAAIDVLKSLRALALKAKTAPKAGVQYLVVDTGYVGGWKSKGDSGKMSRFFKGTNKGLNLDATKYMERCVRTSRYRGTVLPNIHPIWLTGAGAFDKGRTVRIYRVTPRHANVMKWEKNKHKGCWYVAAYSQNVVEKYAKNQLMRRYMLNTSGLAKFALTKAMTQLSTRNASDANQLSQKSKRVAADNIRVNSFGGDEWTVEVYDSLAYAARAFSRSDALPFAMAKAANSISGYMRSRAVDVFDPAIATPFPEIARGGSRR